MFGSAGDVGGKAVAGHHVPADARQQHHAGGSGLLRPGFGPGVDIEFRDDIQVVDAAVDAGLHERTRRRGEWSGAVEDGAEALQSGAQRRRILDGENMVGNAAASERADFFLVSAHDREVQAGMACLLADQLPV
ncbi:MAG TPA: hypothetical protein VFP43_16460 [Mesorhizobium sp.]|nr:hypothetical protein [Mesorhizobium sp.]